MLDFVARVKAIVVTPQSEWPAVARESGDGPCIRYLAILALIPTLARFVGGWQIGGYTPFLPALGGAAAAYVLNFAVVYAVALVVDRLAPRFGGQRSFSNALRLTVYSFTPVWLAGVFLLVPGASFLVLLGLYGFYLTWTGLPVLMKAPEGRSLAYAFAIAICAIVLDGAARLAVIASIIGPR